MTTLYLIPARGGSKGLPGKNIKLLNGIPLIAYSIKAAQKAVQQGTIVVNTDADSIASIAKQYGADVPFIRPNHLANDAASTVDVILHTIDWYASKGTHFDWLVLLQPTSPLRTNKHIDQAFQQLHRSNSNAIVSVCETEHHPLWANELPENLSMKDFLRPEIKGLNRQQLPPYYRLNGAIFISKVSTFLHEKSFIHAESIAYIMATSESVDIDTSLDFKLAELLLQDSNL